VNALAHEIEDLAQERRPGLPGLQRAGDREQVAAQGDLDPQRLFDRPEVPTVLPAELSDLVVVFDLDPNRVCWGGRG
jgi:hypothetical protein